MFLTRFFKTKKSKYIAVAIFLLILCIGGFFLYTKIAYGVTRTWDGGGGDANWDTAANWSGDTAPTASDIANFDNTCVTNCNPTINVAIDVAGINMAATYAGTITQSTTNTITVGNSNWVQANGTFTGGSGDIRVNGLFTQSGGTFTSTTGNLTVGYPTDWAGFKGSFTLSGGTFNHNNGTVTFYNPYFWNPVYGCESYAFPVDIQTSLTLYNVVADSVVACGSNYNRIEAASGDTITILNDYTQNSGSLSGVWEVQGNITIGASANGGLGTLTYTGSGAKTYTSTSGIGPHLWVNTASGSLAANTGTTELSLFSFTISNGTFTAPTGTMTIGPTASVGDLKGSFTVSGGTFSHNNGTVNFRNEYFWNGDCDRYYFPIDVQTSLTLYNVITSAIPGCVAYDPSGITTSAGDTIVVANNFTHTSGVLLGIWEVQGDVTIGVNATDEWSGTATLTFTGSKDQVYTNQGGGEPNGDVTINKPSGTVTLASNAIWNSGWPSLQSVTITSGTLFAPRYSISTGNITVGASGVLYMADAQTLTLGGDLANAGTVKIWGTGVCGGSDAALIRSNVDDTQRSFTGAGTFNIYDADIKDMAGSAAITVLSSTNNGNNGGNWTFSAASCSTLTIPPAVRVGSGRLNIGSGRVNFR